jgi:D-alanyl-lipoteichoic acid acyltransferase DltB (MBOAT superfamily)
MPLGGRGKNRLHGLFNYLVVFTFVALWHDINLRLLMWGWLITLFILPEVAAKLVFPAQRWQNYPDTFRWLCGLGAVCNILMMMMANLVGFVGSEGLLELGSGIMGSLNGRIFFLVACVSLFIGTQLMFEWREDEKRRGADLKF